MTKVTGSVNGNKNWGIAAQLGIGPEPHSWIASNGGKVALGRHEDLRRR